MPRKGAYFLYSRGLRVLGLLETLLLSLPIFIVYTKVLVYAVDDSFVEEYNWKSGRLEPHIKQKPCGNTM